MMLSNIRTSDRKQVKGSQWEAIGLVKSILIGK
jgi:hypothetical protein